MTESSKSLGVALVVGDGDGGPIMIDRAVWDRLGGAADHVARLVAELAAADELVTELVAENEELRGRLAEISGGLGARSSA